jgi:ATP-binding cassette, subfamily B, bacterial HlyB/CyaB
MTFDTTALRNPMPDLRAQSGGAVSATTLSGVPARTPVHPRLMAMAMASRHHHVHLDVASFCGADDQTPSAASLSAWARDAGLWSRAVRLDWRHLLGHDGTAPLVLLLSDGGAAVMAGVDRAREVVLLRSPDDPPFAQPVPVDRLRLTEQWSGEAVLMRTDRVDRGTEAPFSLRWLSGLLLEQRRILRDIGLASLTVSVLTIFPPMVVMTVVDRILVHHSYSTLFLMCVMLAIAVLYETLLGFMRRAMILVVGTRVDTRLSLFVFDRLVRLPLDYFERHPAGEMMHRISQVQKVREFITGKLLTTFLDLITLCVLLPFLFWLSAPLAWIVVGCAGVMTVIILAFLRPLRAVFTRLLAAETGKQAVLGETIFGVKTVKALALEPQRRALWDALVAEAGKWRLAFGRLANWPQTLVTPIERFMWLGCVMVGAYLALTDTTGYMVGSLFAFMMLSQRVSQPLANLARLVEDFEEVGGAISAVAYVLNNAPEADAGARGLRPGFEGALSFSNVTFSYPGTRTPALDRVSFSVPAGTMLGVVGRSGSGKSTVTRLLQGINRDYAGSVKIDGTDLREIGLRHLRSSLGVVLQENFMFRGTIRDNILAGRPGYTLEDAVRAARLAGAEEFIEATPNGYETFIEEGSPNLSGGQRQRLAIARALVTDPRILILDEATSALDPESEALVNANMLRIAYGRTIAIVSHRLSSLTECDQILVLDKGRVADIAPHGLLLERCAIYRQLWNQQNRHLGASAAEQAATASLLAQVL